MGVAMPGVAIVISAIVETLTLPERPMVDKGKLLAHQAMIMVVSLIIGLTLFLVLYEFDKDTLSDQNTDYDTNAIHPPYVGRGRL